MEKLPPSNIEAERAVLGCLMYDPGTLDLIADRLRPEDFYRNIHRAAYQAILTLASQQDEIDYITVKDELERTNAPQDEDPAYLIALMNEVLNAGNIVSHADIVARTSLSRRLVHVGGQIAAIGWKDEPNGLEESEKLLFGLNRHQSRDISSVGDVVDEVLSGLFAMRNHEGKVVGVPTGYTTLDMLLGGLQRSDLIILAARPAMGKSSFALSVAYNAVFSHDQKAAIFSLEMSKDQLTQRLISYETKIPLFRLRNGYINDLEWEKLEQAGTKLHSNHLHIDDTAGITLPALRSKARRLKAMQGIDLLIVDYLQLMTTTENKFVN